MTDTTASAALETTLAYYQAWTAKDIDRAMSFVAADVVCDTPGGKLEGAAAVRGFMEPFARIVTRAELIAAFGDERAALLMYDTDTVPVRHAPGAECHTVDDGKITHIGIVFDRQPFTAARGTANRDVYTGFLEALNRQDLAAAESYVDVAAYRENCVGFTSGQVDWQQACASVAPIWKAIPDLHVELHDIAESPDTVIARGTVSGTAQGRLYGAPATKRRYQASFFDWVRLRDGLIVERVQQADVLAQMRQAYGRVFGVVGVGAMLLRQQA